MLEQELKGSKPFLKDNIEPPFLAIDYGTKRIGLAISDFKGKVSAPLDTLIYTKNRGSEELIEELSEIIKEHRVKTIIMGYPQAFVESHKKVLTIIDAFLDLLKKKINLPVIRFDESFSTKEATDMLLSLGQRSRKSKSKIDKTSAALFLQKFLDNNYKQHETAQNHPPAPEI